MDAHYLPLIPVIKVPGAKFHIRSSIFHIFQSEKIQGNILVTIMNPEANIGWSPHPQHLYTYSGSLSNFRTVITE